MQRSKTNKKIIDFEIYNFEFDIEKQNYLMKELN